MDEDTQLMADSCAALLRSLYGEDNWYRWNEIKQQTQLSNTQLLMSWLLDLAEQDIKQSNIRASDSEVEQVQYPQQAAEYMTSGSEEMQASYANTDLEQEEYETASDNIPPDYHAGVGFSGEIKSEMVADVGETPASSSLHLVNMEGSSDSVEVIYMNDSKSFFCDECKVSLTDIEIVKEHRHIRHSNAQLALSCLCCNQKFSSTQDYVNYHTLSATIQDPSKAHVCSYCAKGFKVRLSLIEHIANKHDKSGPRHECPHCGKKFSHVCNLRTHIRKNACRNPQF